MKKFSLVCPHFRCLLTWTCQSKFLGQSVHTRGFLFVFRWTIELKTRQENEEIGIRPTGLSSWQSVHTRKWNLWHKVIVLSSRQDKHPCPLSEPGLSVNIGGNLSSRDYVSDFPRHSFWSLHFAKNWRPETMCRTSPNFAKLWSSITPKRQTMGAWQTPLWNREVKIKLFKKKLNRSPPSGENLRFEKTKTQVRVHHKSSKIF